ncbi:SafA/ExsA family spore coat assembly protein [Oceanobacillus sp. CFH 90083]|uniref:SafA/ExsA family spore coat assembly protein n=1 Tax=Oceanobacillus sp. CFH 90083 TaxID=2592336 RepID=UPI0018839436|nr:SafA/ExsA family spore coat assembly protein [Oceanobacillus sp. CFH 90083]
MKIHIVQLGDTLWNLAEKYNASFEELKKVNSHLANPEKLMPGMKIKIPGSKKSVQKEVSKKEQMTPVSKKKEETKTAKKEQKKPVQKEEKKKEEHPYKQKTPTPIAVLKEDDQQEKKKEQFEAVMPKMPKVPAIPILEKEMKAEEKPIKKAEPPKPKEHKKEHKKEKMKPSEEQKPACKEKQQPPQQKPAEFEGYQPQPAIPCEPMVLLPQMMPIFYMPCPPMPPMHPCSPYPGQPGMQHGFPMMPPMGDCGCGNQYPLQQTQGTFHPMPAGFPTEQFEAANQDFQTMMAHQRQASVNQINQQAPAPKAYPADDMDITSNQKTDHRQSSAYNPNHLPTSASFVHNPGQVPGFAENRHYFQPDQTGLSDSQRNTFYPKPPFFPELSDNKHDANS